MSPFGFKDRISHWQIIACTIGPVKTFPLFEQMKFFGMFNITVSTKIAESEL
jgi:hypothetical protein